MAESDQPKSHPHPVAASAGNEAVGARCETAGDRPVSVAASRTCTPPAPSSSQSAPGDISSTNFFPPPKPPAASRPLSASVGPPPIPPGSGPKKETVRIPLTPEPLRSSRKKTQPLIAMPNVVSQNPPIAVAPVEKKLNAGVLDASRYVRIDFDYPDLDVFFLAMENSAIISLTNRTLTAN